MAKRNRLSTVQTLSGIGLDHEFLQSHAIKNLQVMIAKADRFAADSLARILRKAYRDSHISVHHTAISTLHALRAQRTDITVAGLTYGDMDGTELVEAIVREKLTPRLLIVSARNDEWSSEIIRSHSVCGYFDSAAEAPDLLPVVVAQLLRGARYFSPKTAQHKYDQRTPLSKVLSTAEKKVLGIIGTGHDEQFAADLLGITKHTVHRHLQALMRKLDVHSRTGVMREALLRGFVTFSNGLHFPALPAPSNVDRKPRQVSAVRQTSGPTHTQPGAAHRDWKASLAESGTTCVLNLQSPPQESAGPDSRSLPCARCTSTKKSSSARSQSPPTQVLGDRSANVDGQG